MSFSAIPPVLRRSKIKNIRSLGVFWAKFKSAKRLVLEGMLYFVWKIAENTTIMFTLGIQSDQCIFVLKKSNTDVSLLVGHQTSYFPSSLMAR